jgi:hypothetical protein
MDRVNRNMAGRRILYRPNQWSDTVIEATVDEVSANGEYVKLSGMWRQAEGLIVVDVLPHKPLRSALSRLLRKMRQQEASK